MSLYGHVSNLFNRALTLALAPPVSAVFTLRHENPERARARHGTSPSYGGQVNEQEKELEFVLLTFVS